AASPRRRPSLRRRKKPEIPLLITVLPGPGRYIRARRCREERNRKRTLIAMIFGFLEARPQKKKNEQLLKLYWNRAAVKRELRDLRRERYDLLDKLKEQEAAIARAREQLEGLERLLTNPLAAANAMVYFQLRHLWDTAAQRLEQFAADLELQREKRERKQLRDAALAKRGRRLEAIALKLTELEHKRAGLDSEKRRLEQRLKRA